MAQDFERLAMQNACGANAQLVYALLAVAQEMGRLAGAAEKLVKDDIMTEEGEGDGQG